MNESNLQSIKQRYGIVGNYAGLNRAIDIAIQVAPTDLSVLIQGESGVGKEVVPRIIHDNSARKHQKYFAINCGSIQKEPLTVNCSAMKREHSLEPLASEKAILE